MEPDKQRLLKDLPKVLARLTGHVLARTETFPPPSLFHPRGVGFAKKQFLEQQAKCFVLNLKKLREFLSQEIGRKAQELTLQAHHTTPITTGSAPLWGQPSDDPGGVGSEVSASGERGRCCEDARAVVSGAWRDKGLGEETNEKARWDDSGHGHEIGRGRDLPHRAGDEQTSGAVPARPQSSSGEGTPGGRWPATWT